MPAYLRHLYAQVCLARPEGPAGGEKASPTATRVEPQLFFKIFLIFFRLQFFLGVIQSKNLD